ncbi:MAG: DUF4142 domain-containing protein [Hyphomicrobiales bacterium]|nr:DUF4142 domain-containing protein [Hyphomicrobiales bacterium]
MKQFLVMSATAFFVASPALAQSPPPANDFIAQTIQGDNAEIAMGKLAQARGGSKGVRDYAKMLVRDHEKNLGEARKLARAMKVKAPSGVPDGARQEQAKLTKLQGADFDKEFAAAMVDDHQKDIAAFQQEANEATDPKVKDFATKSLPTLQKHLGAAQKLQKS